MSRRLKTRNVWVVSHLLAHDYPLDRVVSLPGGCFRALFIVSDYDGRAGEVVRAFLDDEPTQRLIRARRVVGEALDIVRRQGIADADDLGAELLATIATPWPRR